MRKFNTILVTGGAGFIGSNLVRYLLDESDFTGRVVNVDLLTYAGNPENLADVEAAHGAAGDGRYSFERADIRDREAMDRIFSGYGVDAVCHLAAESHVDRSILGPADFVTTNVLGTFTLLEAARAAWGSRQDVLFHHVSTDEVFGSLGPSGYFTEDTPVDPRSPYSASKAGSDHLVMAWHHTWGLPVTLTNCSNNYGPWQFPEKFIPLMILNMLEGKSLPVYGDGKNIRDWLYVGDHNEAVWTVMKSGQLGRSYNIGGENEWENITLLSRLIELTADKTGAAADEYRKTITYVKDRPGHDRRYAIDCSRLKNELGWKRRVDFDEGLRRTVAWYVDNPEWVARVRSGAYRAWVEQNYGNR